PLFGASHYRYGIGRSSGAKVCALQRVYCDVDLRAPHPVFGINLISPPDLLTDIEHWRFIALALTDYDFAAHGDRVHYLAHRFNSYVIGELTIPLAHRMRRGDCRCFDYSQKVETEFLLHFSLKHYASG